MSTKVNKEALYFRQAAVMLGEAEAERHLQIVIDAAEETGNWVEDDCNGECGLNAMFVWSKTPQGAPFWDLIEFAANEEGIAE